MVGLELYESHPTLCRDFPGLLKAWEKAYPGVDVRGEVRKAHAWEVANPKRRKRNKTRFLNNWLAEAQDRPKAKTPRKTQQVKNSQTGLFETVEAE